MINVRDYFKNKEKHEKKTPRINYKEKIKSHKFMIFYRSVLLLLLAAATAAVIFIQWRNKIYTQYTVTSSVATTKPQSGSMVPFSGYLLTYSKDGASCMDAKGNAVWNVTFEMQNPRIDICQNVVAIGDYNGRDLYIMSTSGTLGQITTNKPIRDFRIAANGVAAVIVDDADLTFIYLYDTKGEELVRIRTTMKDSGYPFSFSISPNGTLLCVSYLFVDSGEMKSSVAFYNFGEVGQNNTDHYVSGYDYRDVVVGYTRFLDEKTLFAVSDDRIMFFEGTQKPVSIAERLLNEEIQRVYYGTDSVGLIFNSTDGSSKYRLDVYNRSGQLTHSIGFDMEYTDIIFAEGQIVIYNESECQVFNMEGVEKYNGHFDKAVYTLIPTASAYKYTLITADSIDNIELK
ncbi:MAG: DUF5711 family protein [Roseburia sp.]|nr:DUF5711 family protein [Ruminococcus sp.]MCM1156784.1 DUF5711 family protein [Roseburia sp.]MCM1243371.1 DUF5711 family protein [Roseburia sp.]